MENDKSVDYAERLQTIIAILIAVATVTGAVVAWRASVADDGAGNADFAGHRATLNLEAARALSAVDAYENYSAYTLYRRNSDLAALIAADEKSASPDAARALAHERLAASNAAMSSALLFPFMYLNPDGAYALQRDMGATLADAAREKDLRPDPAYAEADALRNKQAVLLASVTVLAVSLVFFSLVESASGRLQLVLAGLGVLCMVAGVTAAFVVELRGWFG